MSSKQRNQPKNQSKTKKLVQKQAPVSKATTFSPGNLIMRAGKGVVVQNREFVTSLIAPVSANFQFLGLSTAQEGYDLNPSNPRLFPWLAPLATMFEKYRFQKLELTLLSRNPSILAGAVAAAIEYDWIDPVPAGKAQLMQNSTSKSTSVWNDLSLTLDIGKVSRDLPWRYTISNAGDPRIIYSGYAIFGADAPSGATFDLFVDYVVELDIPQPSDLVSTPPMTGSISPIAAELSNDTGGIKYYLPPLPAVVGSIIPKATVFASGIGYLTNATRSVYDVRKMSTRSEITMLTRATNAALTIGQMLLGNPVLRWECLDQLGRFISTAVASDSHKGLATTADIGVTGEAYVNNTLYGANLPNGTAFVLPVQAQLTAVSLINLGSDVIVA